jgi:hypothetical protein
MEEFRSAQGTPVQDECTVVNDQMHSLNLQDAPNSGKRILVCIEIPRALTKPIKYRVHSCCVTNAQ